MPLQAGTELAEGAELLGIEVTGAGKNGIIDGGEMPGGDDECVLSLGVAAPGLGILLHFTEIQCRHHVGDAQRAARMPGLGGCYHANDIPAYLGCDSA